jgi:hypothetical protein
VSGYSTAEWQSFFIAMITAAASLTGLLFVAVSINLDRIIKGGGFLPLRAMQTLATLLLVVLSCALTLVPQNIRILGLEVFVLAAPTLFLTVRGQIYHRRKNPKDPLHWYASWMAGTAVATVPATAAGLSLLLRGGGGLYWLAAAALLGLVGAVYGAWVLLVEIVR